MDVNKNFVEGISDKDSKSCELNSEEDAKGKEDEENEDDAPNPNEMYTKKEIEGDFECIFLYKSSFC